MATVTWMKEGVARVDAEGTCGYVFVAEGRALMVDCPSAAAAKALAEAGIPAPEIVLHTQVQAEHCREGEAFPGAAVWVNEEAKPVAVRSAAFFKEAETVWPDDRAWETLGEEKYGIGGCMTERPPAKPLNVTKTFTPGETLRWRGIELEVVALPVSGKRSVGFLWRKEGVLLSGDAVCAGGTVANLYDMERSYGGLCVADARRVAAWLGGQTSSFAAPLVAWPTTGGIVESPAAAMERVAELIAHPNRVGTASFPPEEALQNFPVIRSFGRYREVAKAIYQNTNYGNIVLFVDNEGNGLMIDPANCVWLDWAGSVASMHEDLDMLEKETGLKRVTMALMTHPHGDHIQYCDLLRERYGTEIVAASDVADQMERPETFPYPCMNDWYNFPFKNVKVDRRLAYETPFSWQGIDILPMYTPGHCVAHTAFGLLWNGERVACSGDVLQYGGGDIGVGLPFCHNGNAVPECSPEVTFRRLAAFAPDLVCGGHSRSFRNPAPVLAAWADLWQRQMAALVPYVVDGDLSRATRPWR
ncbi:MAG: MBL fold metallo-hydrolase [Kiritimatiellaeota bacterium]|nr:MBL fold metallo-hydrolase [Kiritimatiellota bacterium]